MADQTKVTLDKKAANNILNNVLESCNIPPSSESMDKIMKKRAIERTPLIVLKYIALVFLIVAAISPLFFRRDPDFKVVSASKTVVVSSHSLYDDCFIMVLTGAADYKNISAKKNDGAVIFPDTVDSSSGLVIFPYNGDALNIYIPTLSGECIQAVLNETK